jgi:homospermidine synthase
VVGVRGDWTPLSSRERLFDEAVDGSDPWQFVNFRVA